MGAFEIIIRAMAILGFLVFGIFTYFTLKKTITLTDIRQEMRGKELCSHLFEKTRQADSYVYRSFRIHTEKLDCVYGIREGFQSGIKNKLYERLRITIDGKRGLLNATFCNDELVAWNIGQTNEMLVANDPSIVFALKDILGAVQNAAELTPER